MASRSVWLYTLRSVPLGNVRRSKPLVFSLMPRSHGHPGVLCAPGLPAEKIAEIKALVASGRGPAEVCKALGIDHSTYYKHACVPNKTTLQKLRDSEAGRDVYHAKDAADLFAQLGIEETTGSAHVAPDVPSTKETWRRATGDKPA